MTGATRGQEIKELEEAVRALRERQHRAAQETEQIKQSLDDIGEIKEMMAAITLKYDKMAGHLYGKKNSEWAKEESGEGDGSSSRQPAGFGQQITGIGTRYTRLDFPRFNGEDPTGWLYKCERFFDFNSVEAIHWVKLAVLHLEGRAL